MRRFVLFCVMLLATVPGHDVFPAFAQERRVALIVGNSRYEQAPALRNPENDARAVSAALQRLGFDVVDGLNLPREGMQAALREFASRLEAADVGLFYYAGHGLQVDGRNYLVPVDAELAQGSDLYFEAVEFGAVLRLVEEKAALGLLFLDACRDNPLARNLARGMGTRSTAVGRGLAPVESGAGTLLVYATEPGNVAYDGEGRHSPFTQAVLNHIEEPGLEVRQMLSRVRRQVMDATNGSQVPWDHSSLTRDFFFKPADEPPDAAQAAGQPSPVPPMTEALFWQAISGSQNPEDLRIYLEQFPKGLFAPLAKNRLQQLEIQDLVRLVEEATADDRLTTSDPPGGRSARDHLRRLRDLSPAGAPLVTEVAQRVVDRYRARARDRRIAGDFAAAEEWLRNALEVAAEFSVPTSSLEDDRRKLAALREGGSPEPQRGTPQKAEPTTVAVPPVSSEASSPQGERCRNILGKTQLGEPLSDADRAFLRNNCRS